MPSEDRGSKGIQNIGILLQHDPEDFDLNLHCHENLKYGMILI
jgi:hypothetical protein